MAKYWRSSSHSNGNPDFIGNSAVRASSNGQPILTDSTAFLLSRRYYSGINLPVRIRVIISDIQQYSAFTVNVLAFTDSTVPLLSCEYCILICQCWSVLSFQNIQQYCASNCWLNPDICDCPSQIPTGVRISLHIRKLASSFRSLKNIRNKMASYAAAGIDLPVTSETLRHRERHQQVFTW